MNKIIIPFRCCQCKNIDILIVTEKSWLKYKFKKEYLKGLVFKITHCAGNVQGGTINETK